MVDILQNLNDDVQLHVIFSLIIDAYVGLNCDLVDYNRYILTFCNECCNGIFNLETSFSEQWSTSCSLLSSKNPSLGQSLVPQANVEANKAIAIDHLDTTYHTLKGLTLKQGPSNLYTTFTPNVVKSLNNSKKADALMSLR